MIPTMNKRTILWIVAVNLALALYILYAQLTIFVIPPIGSQLPEGATLVVSRLNKTNFIDSPDALCKRIQGDVNIFCRVEAADAVLGRANVYAKLPYSRWLYLLSTRGNEYLRR
jgi:hypothetical protein